MPNPAKKCEEKILDLFPKYKNRGHIDTLGRTAEWATIDRNLSKLEWTNHYILMFLKQKKPPRIPKSLPLRQIDTENIFRNHFSLAMPISYRFRRHLRVLRGCVAAATLASALLRASIDHSSSQQVSTNLNPPNKSLQAKLETATNAENCTFLLPNLTIQSTNLQNSLKLNST